MRDTENRNNTAKCKTDKIRKMTEVKKNKREKLKKVRNKK